MKHIDLISRKTVDSIVKSAYAEADALTNEAYQVKGWAGEQFWLETYVQELENLLRVFRVPQRFWAVFPWYGELPWYVK